MRFAILTFCILLLSEWQLSFAQSMRVETISQEDGLPNDLTKSLIMDSLGFIWVATDDGVVYIYGRSFYNVENPPKLSNNFKQMLFTQHFGFLSSADPGIFKIETDASSIKASLLSDTYPALAKVKLHYPKTIYESKHDKTVWIADLRKVYKLDDDSVVTYNFGPKCHTDHFTRSFQFFESNQHFFTFSQRGFLYRLNNQSDIFEEISTPLDSVEIYDVLQMNELKFLVGHKKGLSVIEFNAAGSIQHYRLIENSPVLSICKKSETEYIIGTESSGAAFLNLTDNDSNFTAIAELKSLTINDILIDFSGNYWFATDHGIFILREVMFGDPFSWLTRNYIQDLKRSANGDLYFSDGKVYCLKNGSQKPELFYEPEQGMVLKLCLAPGQLWMTTNDGRIICKPFEGKPRVFNFNKTGLAIYGIEMDKEGYIWFIQEQKNPILIRMSTDGSWVNMTPASDSIRSVNCIKLSPEKEIYIGGQGFDHYLYKYDYESRQLVNLSLPLTDEQYKSIKVTDVAFDGTNQIKLATTSGLWVRSSTQMLHFDLGEMSNDMIHSIVFDHNKQLWFTNANGISQIRGTDYILYNNNDGLPSKTCTFRTLIVQENNEIWAGTISGLAKGRIIDELKNTPRPVLVSTELSGDMVDFNTRPSIRTNDLVNFNFGTPVYPAKYLKYRYSLTRNGIEHEILPASSESLLLSNLPRGNYILKVQVRNHGNYLWSNPLNINFEVKKIWYTRVWVIVLLLLGLVVSGIALFTYLRWKNKKKTQKLEQIIEERTRSLQEQNEELQALNTKLQEARDAAEMAIKSKDRFFSILAHDLKSPFNTLIGFAQLLVFNRDELSNEDMQHLLDEMLSTSENTYKLLQNLLDWARSQTGAIKLKSQPFNLHDLVNDVLKVSEPSARQKQIAINVMVDNNIRLVSDVLFLTTVVRNLVANAIKFSFPGTVIIIEAHKNNEQVEIKIKDRGVGIPEEKIAVLFSIEHSYSTSGTSNEKGTGLGLILCHEFITKLGGTLAVDSKLGLGSTFSINIPVELPVIQPIN